MMRIPPAISATDSRNPAIPPLWFATVRARSTSLRTSWDIIILDRMLPGGVDGLSIIATIRSLGKTTPVLILSALASLDERVRGLRGGGDDYLTKPFALSELLARVQALLRRSGLKEDVAELQI